MHSWTCWRFPPAATAAIIRFSVAINGSSRSKLRSITAGWTTSPPLIFRARRRTPSAARKAWGRVNRRLTLPQAFLAADGVLRLALNISGGLVVHPAVIERNLLRELPFIATENLMMAAVAAGGNRQQVHECIRAHSHAVA